MTTVGQSANLAALFRAVCSPFGSTLQLASLLTRDCYSLRKLLIVNVLYSTLCHHKTYINSEADVEEILLFQTLTGKEIEIDIEPTDKVKYNVQHICVCFLSCVDSVFCLLPVQMKVERIKERVEEKEGIPPQQQRLIYSGKQMWVSPFTAKISLAEICLPFSSLFKHAFLVFCVSPGTMRRRLPTTRSKEAQCSTSCWR